LDQKQTTNLTGTKTITTQQVEVLEKIAKRVIMEQNQSSTHKQQNDTYDFKNTELKHPLRWLVHGGPGVGKSYVIACIKEMFTQTMQWTQGVEFEITSLQASVADQLGGDTIHHALGIQPFNKAEEANSPAALREVAKRLAHLRWLIIDEVSMISAGFLAQIDTQLRSILHNINNVKPNGQQESQPFGGLNVIFLGDFWQLDPPLRNISISHTDRICTNEQKIHTSPNHGTRSELVLGMWTT